MFEPPSGPGVRVDGYGYAGYRTNPNFDSLLAKVIVKAPTLRRGAGARRAGAGRLPPRGRADEHRLPARAARRQGRAGGQGPHALRRRACEEADRRGGEAERRSVFPGGGASARGGRQAGAKVDAVDPLAVLAFGKAAAKRPRPPSTSDAPEGTVPVPAPMQGTIVSLSVQEGDAVARRPAAADHGRHEDAARDQEPGARLRAAHRGRGGRDDLRRPRRCCSSRRPTSR